METTPGIDLHGADVQFAPLQLGLAKQSGLAFVFAKATQGSPQGFNFADPAYSTIRTQCATVGGVLFGTYHFFQPGDDPIQQAKFFVSTASPVWGDLRPMLDVEPGSGLNPDPQSALVCYMEIKRLTGLYPWIYSSADFYLNNLMGPFDDGPIWLAFYPGGDPNVFLAANPQVI